MSSRMLKLLMTLVASAMVALGGVAGATATVASGGGPNCWDWSPPDQ